MTDALSIATQALEDIVNPLGYFKRYAQAQGRQLGGMAYTVANDIHTVQRIAQEALCEIKTLKAKQSDA
jgi:hypothetical protein